MPRSAGIICISYKTLQCAGFIPQDVGDAWINPPSIGID